jgi:hypothetical protein
MSRLKSLEAFEPDLTEERLNRRLCGAKRLQEGQKSRQ